MALLFYGRINQVVILSPAKHPAFSVATLRVAENRFSHTPKGIRQIGGEELVISEKS
jgi:hypothetical protein